MPVDVARDVAHRVPARVDADRGRVAVVGRTRDRVGVAPHGTVTVLAGDRNALLHATRQIGPGRRRIATVHVVAAVAVDATHARFVVHVGRGVVAPVAVVVLEQEVLVRVASVERVVPDRRVEQSRVPVRALPAGRLGRVLVAATHVLVLIEADAPELHDRTVRALVAAGARVIVDALHRVTVRHRLRHADDLVTPHVRTFRIVDVVHVERLELVDVRVRGPRATTQAVRHVTRRATGRAEVAIAVVRARTAQVAIATRERDLFVVQVRQGGTRDEAAVRVRVVRDLGHVVVGVVVDVRGTVGPAHAEDRVLDQPRHLTDRSRERIEGQVLDGPERQVRSRSLVQPDVLGDLVVHAGREHRAAEHSGLGRQQAAVHALRVTAVTRSAALSGADHAQVARVHELQVLERGVGLPVDRVVRELVHPGQRQLVEVRGRVLVLEVPVADLGRRRHVARSHVEPVRVAAVTDLALEVVRARERMRVLDARTVVVVLQRAVVTLHAGGHRHR